MLPRPSLSIWFVQLCGNCRGVNLGCVHRTLTRRHVVVDAVEAGAEAVEVVVGAAVAAGAVVAVGPSRPPSVQLHPHMGMTAAVRRPRGTSSP